MQLYTYKYLYINYLLSLQNLGRGGPILGGSPHVARGTMVTRPGFYGLSWTKQQGRTGKTQLHRAELQFPTCSPCRMLPDIEMDSTVLGFIP